MIEALLALLLVATIVNTYHVHRMAEAVQKLDRTCAAGLTNNLNEMQAIKESLFFLDVDKILSTLREQTK